MFHVSKAMPRACGWVVRLRTSALAVSFLTSLSAFGKNAPTRQQPAPAPKAPVAPETAPGPEAPAPAAPTGEEPSDETTPESTPETPEGETVPAEDPARAPAPEPAPAPASSSQPAPSEAPPSEASAPVDPMADSVATDDDYAGATDAALVEEKEGPKDLSLGVALDVTFPMGNAAKYIKSASLQGLSLDLRYYAWGNIGIGAGVALDSLSKKLTGTATWDNATFTGTQVRELSYTPITLKGYYAWRDQRQVVPYVAAGVGAARSVRRLVVGISGLSEAAWHFALVPEAGLQIPVGPTMILTNVRLNYLPASGGIEDQMFANFSVGLAIQ